jgi:hypothetical protein
MKAMLSILAIAILTACTTTGTTGSTTTPPSPTVGQQLIADLTAAQTIACAPVSTAAGAPVADPLGCACYQVLVPALQSPGLVPQGPVVGPISGIEAARIVTNNLAAGIPVNIKLACGGLYMDEHGKLLTMAALVTAIVPK